MRHFHERKDPSGWRVSNRTVTALCALNGLLGVALGAFAAHAAPDEAARALIRTGAGYQLTPSC